MQIIQLPAFDDNYLYLLESDGCVAAVDPGDAEVIDAELVRRGWSLGMILCTHHHPDHVGGVKNLKQKYSCEVVGPQYDAKRIPVVDRLVAEGDVVTLGQSNAKVLFTPGHTVGHILYHFAEEKALFCGDTLFHLGCGRMFEGTPEQFWNSLQKIKALPEETLCYCAHEYSAANARFALSVDGDNQDLQRISAEIDAARSRNEPTVPFKLSGNLAANPFLRADDQGLQQTLKSSGDATGAFAQLRKMKDRF